ncbi:Arginase family enzyme [Butyrivibrio sp. INlla21]|nr:Arginase family enzyme [Butyrivibrio sp. INlla21]
MRSCTWQTLQDNDMMNGKITVFNFSSVYEEESFYQGDKSSCFCGSSKEALLLDMKDIPGTNCMCDDIAVTEIKERIAVNCCANNEGLNVEKETDSAALRDFLHGIHFIDSGNYHYMSYILLSMVKEPFSLVVFDHHPDMQPPKFGDILSCGGWVLKVLQDNPNVRDVHIIGADEKLISELPKEDRARVSFYTLDDIKTGRPKTEYPVYLSVDKDVVKREELITNWDQGEMNAYDLLGCIRELASDPERKLIGIDICGECAPDQEGIDVGAAIAGNDEFNRLVIDTI